MLNCVKKHQFQSLDIYIYFLLIKSNKLTNLKIFRNCKIGI